MQHEFDVHLRLLDEINTDELQLLCTKADMPHGEKQCFLKSSVAQTIIMIFK